MINPPWIRPKWTEEQVEMLKKLTNEGLSCSQIAIELHTTRNAIIGKQHRIDVRSKRSRGADPELKQHAPTRRYKRAPWAVKGLLANGTDRRPEVLTDLPPEQVANPIKFIDLKQHHCRWPVHEFGCEAMFCGADAFPKYPYCARHCRMAYVLAPRSLTRAEHELRLRRMVHARKGKAAA